MPAKRLQKLECLRGFAAVYIVVHHFAHLYLLHRWFALPFAFGPEVVMLFFILSGFVICYSTTKTPSDLLIKNYALKRIRRIYPIFLCGLALGYLCQAFVARSWFTPDWKTLAGNLAMFQDFKEVKLGVTFATLYDVPLWSLSYEWWFYALFLVIVKLEPRTHLRRYWAASLSLLGVLTFFAVPNQGSLFLMLFVLWWSGVELAREYVEQETITWKRQASSIAALLLMLVICLVPVARAIASHTHLPLFNYPVLFCRQVLAALVFLYAGIVWHKCRFIGFDKMLGSFAAFAPISYAIYVVHFPLLMAVETIDPGRFLLLKICFVCGTTLLIAHFLERRLQPLINSFSNPLLIPPSAAVYDSDEESIQNLALDV